MRTVAVACVKNEADIIEAFVRHTTALVDDLVILDNGSTDETSTILRRLEREGLRVHITEDPSSGYWQSRRMTQLMREQAVNRFQADWIFPLDADEFLITPTGGPLIPPGGSESRPWHIFWKTYVPNPLDDPREINPVRRIRHRLVEEPKPCFKAVVPGKLARHPESSLAQGNHFFCIRNQPVEHISTDHAHLAHFPGRSAAQLSAKIAIGYFQYAAMHQKSPEWGYHYGAPFEIIKTDPVAFAASFHETILRYTLLPGEAFEPRLVEDPTPYAGGLLRYTAATEDRSLGLRAIFDYVAGLARRCADAHAENDELKQEYLTLVQEKKQWAVERDRLECERKQLAEEKASLLEHMNQLVDPSTARKSMAGTLARFVTRWVRKPTDGHPWA